MLGRRLKRDFYKVLRFGRWLYPGMGVKRWIVLAFLGASIGSFGLALLLEVFFPIHRALGPFFPDVKQYSLFFGLLCVTFGGFVFLAALRKLIVSLVNIAGSGKSRALVDKVYQKRYLDRGPKIVVLGGGTGLSVLLKGLKEFTSNITAVVTVADDGGSSGKLRDELGILPPGDIRSCMVALAHSEKLMDKLFEYRFTNGNNLGGHNLGNLLIAAMTKITGSFDQAVKELSRILAIRGQVLPATLEDIVLVAEYKDGEVVKGESSIPKRGKAINRVYLEPREVKALPEAIQAMEEADAIILGPGSLYTSLLPNLLISDIKETLKKSEALKIYICNIMTQPGETDGYTASDHVKALLKHLGEGVFDRAIINVEPVPEKLAKKYNVEHSTPVKGDIKEIEALGIEVLEENLIYPSDLVRHHPNKLSKAIMEELFREKVQMESNSVLDFYLLAEKLKGKN